MSLKESTKHLIKIQILNSIFFGSDFQVLEAVGPNADKLLFKMKFSEFNKDHMRSAKFDFCVLRSYPSDSKYPFICAMTPIPHESSMTPGHLRGDINLGGWILRPGSSCCESSASQFELCFYLDIDMKVKLPKWLTNVLFYYPIQSLLELRDKVSETASA
jgi:hypothetical protein